MEDKQVFDEEQRENLKKEGNRKILKDRDIVIQLGIIGILVIILWFYQRPLAFIFTLVLIYLIYDSFNTIKNRREEFVKYVESLSDEFDSSAKHAIFNMPFPLVMLNEDGKINWYNTPFLNLMNGEDILGKWIQDLVPEIKGLEVFEEDNKAIDINFGDRNYKVYPNIIDTKRTKSKTNEIYMLYWVDNTNYHNLINRYKDERVVISYIYVDNYHDVRNSTPDIKRPLVMAEIDRKLNTYFKERDGIVRKYENDKYLVVFTYEVFEELEENRFDLLDEFREIDLGNTIPVTLSMGVSVNSNNLNEAYNEASGAIDVALGRGGDQVVVRRGTKLDFYGGKSKAIEKRNKVRSRVIGYALRQLIDQAGEVFVMGHKNPDMDSYGASIGILSAIKKREKKGYMVLNDVNPSIKNIHETMREVQPEIEEKMVTTDEALNLVTDKSLLVMVDNHKPSFTEAPELVEKIDKVVIIDHHRRGEEFVEDPVLVYLEPYASSTCELVTEVLSYMGDEIKLTKFEAEALLAGITVDTKNFSFQTGVRTFEAASTLKRAGADSTQVSQFFRDDINTFIYKAEVIQSAKIIKDVVAIGRLDRDMDNSILVAAQSADELLTVSGIEASFVMTRAGDRTHISGRSLGNISVQIILERLGGGGHLTSAGAQLDLPMDEAEIKLIEAIEEYMEE